MRAGWLCSFPMCRKLTVGATQDEETVIDIGTAAHICAAAPLGPRYDATQSASDRSSVKNGIWMCQVHGKAIDSQDSEFTVAQLHEWKKQAEIESRRRVLFPQAVYGRLQDIGDHPVSRLLACAQADLEVFRRTIKWPRTSVPLALKVDGFDGPVNTDALARASVVLDDLILVAEPGMGKTATLFQIAEGLLTSGTGIPLILPLGDWATENAKILASILGRPAFKSTTEDDLRTCASRPGLVLLLDGWNELDSQARRRAQKQLAALKAELPEIGIVVSARKQTLDVPFDGLRIELLPLDERQQTQMATALRGQAGAMMLNRALRTSGIRELVTIPLYLMTLLSLPEHAPFPSTKEELLRRFVTSHEEEPECAEALYMVTRGFQHDYLADLATYAMRADGTAISDNNARRCIVGTAIQLVDNCQITTKPEPGDVLETLVSNHLLVRTADSTGYAFQHQQFQEWYAAGVLGKRILAGINHKHDRDELKADIFDRPVWEEAILFAVEHLARGDSQQKAACGQAILCAFEVDPDLAAEMIHRATDEVWGPIATTILNWVARWHAHWQIDGALRFMLASGRFEFFDAVWPLISCENDQVSLNALRQVASFRPSILGAEGVGMIKGLSTHPRTILLYEMAWRGDMDALDLVTAITKEDTDPAVQIAVIEVLADRRAGQHIAAILRSASNELFDLIVAKGIVDDVEDESVKEALLIARERSTVVALSDEDRLRAIAYAINDLDRADELADLIAKVEIDEAQSGAASLIQRLWGRYPSAAARGLLSRLYSGHMLFPGADDLLASAGIVLEDDRLLELALADPRQRDDRSDAAASLLGPKTAGRLIDAFLKLNSDVRVDERTVPEALDAVRGLRSRIAHVPGSSLVAAVLERSSTECSSCVTQFVDLLVRPNDGVSERGRSFDADALATIRDLFEKWAGYMLLPGNAKRSEIAALAGLAECAAHSELLLTLGRLLDEDLRRYRSFRREAENNGWKRGLARDEAQSIYTGLYQRAFMAIRSPNTDAMMGRYLADEDFGELAAGVLAAHWRAANESPKNEYGLGGVDFSGVNEMRKARAAAPVETCWQAELIFAEVEKLIVNAATDEQKRLAVSLGTIASRLPHGRRADTIHKLVALSSRRKRPDLLLNLVLSGEKLDFAVVAAGIEETFEAAKLERWILTQSEGYELRVWLRLLPFVNRAMEALPLIRAMPAQYREPHFLQGMLDAFRWATASDADDALFELAQGDSRFYRDYHWRRAIMNLDSATSAPRVFELVLQGAISSTESDWDLVQVLAQLIAKSGKLRSQVYALLETSEVTPGLEILARSVVENLDEEGLLLLAKLEQQRKFRIVDDRAIERVVTENVPVEGFSGAYDVVPVATGALRRRLLELTTGGAADDVAAHFLRVIDACRNQYGKPESEPRHPDLSSGKPWPILRPDTYTEKLSEKV